MAVLQSSPKRIYLLRHAEALWPQPGERDFDRPLSESGFAEAEVVADRAADRKYIADIVISSTAIRCRQTADAIKRASPTDVEFQFVDDLYNAPVSTYLEVLSAQRDGLAVMIIGHNPSMEQTLESLIGEDALLAALPAGFPTAGFAVLDPPDSGSGMLWRLIDFLED